MTSTVPEAIRGNAGIFLTFQKDANPATPFDGDVKAFAIEGEDADDSDLTFLEAAEGGAQVDTVTVTALQSTKAGSFWRFCWDNPGAEVAVVYGPHGNAVASADKPHFLMTVKMGNRPNIGGEAQRTKTRFDFETSLEVLDGPTLDTGA